MKNKKRSILHRVRLQLTLLCTGITVLITAAMSLSYLYISEKNLKESYFSSFQSDMNTLLSSLADQTVITHKWLSQMEGNGKYLIDIRDNGVEFLWGNWNAEQQKERSLLIDAGWDYYNRCFSADLSSALFSTPHLEFSFSSSGQGTPDYYGCAAFSRRENGTLSILILKPLAQLTGQIRAQRRIFAVLILAACSVLGLFSWYFTGKLLAPVEKSRQSQIRFVAAASHELRTPLSVILSAASACKKAPPQEQAHFFSIISEEGESMSRLISDLLTLACADSQSFTLCKKECEMDTLLLNTFEAFEPLAQKKGYALSVFLPDPLSAGTKNCTAVCDNDRIRQVLSILIHNAFCYTPPGSHIALSLGTSAEGITLSVRDDGPGVPDEAKARIFERFYRADKAHSDSGHFGLGLSIAEEIMRAHRGSITVSDTPGGGATFTLTLPLAR